MGKYQGTYNRNLDAKKRLQVPSKLVEGAIPAKFYTLRGLDGCISVYDQAGYDELMLDLRSRLKQGHSQMRYIRNIMMTVNTLDVDSHGKITLGEALCSQYGIKEEVLVLGVIDHFEIWDPKGYEDYLNADSATFEELSERSAAYNG